MSEPDDGVAPQPNMFTLAGAEISVVASTSGIDGRPSVQYRDAEQTMAYSGDEVTVEDTSLGSLVSVVTVKTVDAGNTVFSVVLPRVNPSMEGPHEVTTLGMATVNRTSFLPNPSGQLSTYSTVELSGTASLVEF